MSNINIKQLLNDENEENFSQFQEHVTKWKQQNKEFFNSILSAKKYEDIKKILKDKSSFEKRDGKLIEIISIFYRLCAFITNSAFGLIISDIESKEAIYRESFYGLDLVNWIYELLSLESRESSSVLCKLFYDAELILPLNDDIVNHMDNPNSIYQFNIIKLKIYQKYLKYGKKESSVFLSQDEVFYSGQNSIMKKSIYAPKLKRSVSSVNNHFNVDKQYELEKPTEITQTPDIEFEENYVHHIQQNFGKLDFCIYRSITNEDKLMFFIVENIPHSSYDENAKRLVMEISEEPFNNGHFFHIAMMSNDRKEINSRYHLKELHKLECDAKDLFFNFENKMLENTKRYKFGVIYAKEGQMEDENAIFQNSETTPGFTKFLNHLGDKIKLKDWGKFAGGLNTKDNTTGEYSYYKNFKDIEIMFHVTTLLPDDKFDEQRIAKKKHTGNDLVVIIFCESPNVSFSPKILTSQFNHVFIFVTVEKTEGNKTFYGINVATKSGVAPIPPGIPDPPLFKEGENFSNFLLHKLINAERAAMYAPDFSKKTKRTRKALLEDIDKQIHNLPKIKEIHSEPSFIGKLSSIFVPKENSDPKKDIKLNIEKAEWIDPIAQKEWKLMEVYSEKKVFTNKNEIIIPLDVIDKTNTFYRVVKGGVSVIYNKTVVQKFTAGNIFIDLSNSYEKFLYITNEPDTEVLAFDMLSLYYFFEKNSKIGTGLFTELSLVLATHIKNLNEMLVKKQQHSPINIITQNETSNEENNVVTDKDSTYQQLFHLPKTEVLVESFPCIHKHVLNFNGTLFVSQNFVCFYGKIFQKESKLVIETTHVKSIKHTKKNLTIKTDQKKQKFIDLVHNEHASELILNFANQKSNLPSLRRNVSGVLTVNTFDLTVHCWKILYSCSSILSFSDKEVILKQDVTDDCLYYIIKGNCKIVKTDKLKKESTVLSVLPQGVFFGELSFLLGSLTTADVVSVGDTQIFSLEKEKLRILFKRSSFLAARFFKNLMGILIDRVVSILHKNVQLFDEHVK